MSDSVKKWYEMQEEIKVSLQADEEMAKAGIGQESGLPINHVSKGKHELDEAMAKVGIGQKTVKIQVWQWNTIKEVLHDYLDEYDHREDVRQILIKINEQIL